MDFQKYVDGLEREALTPQVPVDPDPLEMVLKGSSVELYCNLVDDTLFLVADEEDAARLGEPRGTSYTAAEARMVCRIEDTSVVREVHTWKRKFNGTVQGYQAGGAR